MQNQSEITYDNQATNGQPSSMDQMWRQQAPWQAQMAQGMPPQGQPWGMQPPPMAQPIPAPFPQQPGFPPQAPVMQPQMPVPGFPGIPVPTSIPQIWEPGMLPMEMSYIENILRLNRGKRVKVYMTYENNPQWPAVTYTGIIQEAGRDHIVLSDPQTGKWYLLLMVNLDYIVFDEEITYEYPFGAASPMATYPPR